MSNDLISRSALLREMTDRTFRNALHEFRHYQNIVLKQPTAYDMDKVVEEMEEHKKSITGRRERNILDAAGKNGAKAAVERDIKIVKSGGNWSWNL